MACGGAPRRARRRARFTRADPGRGRPRTTGRGRGVRRTGIGKSRLLWSSRAPRRAVTWFYPGPRRSSSVTCRSLSSLMRWTSTSPAWSHIALPNWTVRSRQSSGMSSRRFGPSPALASGAPQQERYHSHRAVRQLLELLAQSKPLVLVLDDFHWADAGSVELLGTAAPPACSAGARCACTPPPPDAGASWSCAREGTARVSTDPHRGRRSHA